MSSSNYFRSWIDRPHLDPNTRLLTEEYQRGITEFMGLVHRQPEAKTENHLDDDGNGRYCKHAVARMNNWEVDSKEAPRKGKDHYTMESSAGSGYWRMFNGNHQVLGKSCYLSLNS
ncbi:hypothetical protein DY000_02025920 [Brassica cretica]|uniref:NAC domain-containing protein n=1 Tax=Brassica cretica TaxID=69181 RepID=A0ABQ7EP38_BRACR|nr:hypothetical protein DY000_02025920 [Brassica cretica]